MNVWLWGPALWPIVHGSAQLMEKDSSLTQTVHRMISSLRTILPCSYCRISQNTFLDELGLPKSENALQWSHTLHQKVNTKLEMQRIDKVRESRCTSISKGSFVWDELKTQMCRNVMFNEPSLEVLTKRMILHSTNPWTQMDVMTFLVVLAIHAQGPTLTVGRVTEEIAPQATAVPTDVLEAQNEFISALQTIHKELDAPAPILQFLQKQLRNNSVQRTTEIGRRMFPDLDDQDIIQRLRLYRAGACLNGSCV